MSPESRERPVDYPVRIEFDDQDNLYVAQFIDLPGCSASGSSVQEAYDEAQRAKEGWLRLAEEQGLPIPQPSRTDEYSGRILLRLPSSLHAALVDRAKAQATSLNQYAVHLLSGAVVGNAISAEIERLRTEVVSLERNLNQLSRSMEFSFSAPAQQMAGTQVVPIGLNLSQPSQRTGGSAYAAGSGNVGQGNWIH